MFVELGKSSIAVGVNVAALAMETCWSSLRDTLTLSSTERVSIGEDASLILTFFTGQDDTVLVEARIRSEQNEVAVVTVQVQRSFVLRQCRFVQHGSVGQTCSQVKANLNQHE